ncbi:HNH endonuclease family protein [Nocardioides panacisoli]|uniref:HNH endonuclease family protein n=1 Tax=Nocardioides panacisoli TaxID=627624 RepID=UPI001C624FD9|nr:HNH endonuclease family protein [Nocardioides panacisoli]QYJ03659.1 HNH endonuclease family protein [Nocardioides panacisoli]
MTRWAWAIAVASTALVAAGCLSTVTTSEERTPRGTVTAGPSTSVRPVQPQVPIGQRLAGLRVEPRPAYADDYDRDAFGSAWADIDDNGCNQRDDVLLRDAVEARVQQQGACDHDVVAGTWVDPYTGATLRFDDLKDPRQAQALQIDHVVPLSEAWKSGARDWSDERRSRFANSPANLLSVDGPTNQSKGDDDPAAWRPRKDYQCSYAKRWIRVKSRWDLAIDASERDALTEMLGFC